MSLGPKGKAVDTESQNWMLRVVGSDIHLFGKGLLAEYPVVREVYDQNGVLSFQLLGIKPQAKEAMERGQNSIKIFRFYAFSYGFMRDIVYRQLLPAQRKELHKGCSENVRIKYEGAERGSPLEILQYRHDLISETDLLD